MTAFANHTGWQRRTLILPIQLLALSGLAGCEDNPSVTCGHGTERSGNQCVSTVDGAGGADAGDPGPVAGSESAPVGGDGAGGAGSADQAPKFAGITSTAPAADVSVQITWQPAKAASTPASDLVYRVYVSTKSGSQNFAKPSITSPPGATSALVGNLEPDSDYYFVVRAVDAAGLEDQNEQELVGTPTADDAPPSFDGLEDGKPAGAAAVELFWSPAEDDKTPPEGISYIVRWSTSEGGAPLGTVVAQTSPGATSIVVSGLPAPSTKYFFSVSAQDAAGNGETSSVVRQVKTGDDVTPPRFIGCTGAADPGATTALITWEPASDDTTPADQITYNVYAFTQGVDEDTAFGNPAGSFVGGTQGRVEALLSGTEYSFVCRAQDVSENEDENRAFRVLETKSDGDPPIFDGIVSADTDSTTAVLSWDAGEDPRDQTHVNELVYLIYQSTNPDGVFDDAPVAMSNPGATNIKLSGLKSATHYYWGVRAQDKALNIDENDRQADKSTLVSLALDIQPILSRHCVKSGCHGANNPPQGMNLDVGSTYTAWVDVTAREAPALKRIQPKHPELSYVINKLEGTQATVGGTGSQMPPVGNEAPTIDNIALIKQWISEGAGNN